MEEQSANRLMLLCEQAAKEKDSPKLAKLVEEINDLLDNETKSLRYVNTAGSTARY